MRKYGDGLLTEKDMGVLRETDYTEIQRDMRVGNIKDYSLKHRVSLAWDLNEDAKRDLMVRMTIDDKTVILDAEELMRYLRWV